MRLVSPWPRFAQAARPCSSEYRIRRRDGCADHDSAGIRPDSGTLSDHDSLIQSKRLHGRQPGSGLLKPPLPWLCNAQVVGPDFHNADSLRLPAQLDCDPRVAATITLVVRSG